MHGKIIIGNKYLPTSGCLVMMFFISDITRAQLRLADQIINRILSLSLAPACWSILKGVGRLRLQPFPCPWSGVRGDTPNNLRFYFNCCRWVLSAFLCHVNSFMVKKLTMACYVRLPCFAMYCRFVRIWFQIEITSMDSKSLQPLGP